MKLGLISDIHSDLVLLEKALALLDQHNVDQLLCLGDAVEADQPNSDTVIALLRKRDIPTVRDNHEQFTLGHQAWLRNQGAKGNPAFQVRLLKDETLEYIQNLPEIRRYDWEGRHVVINHGTLWSLFPTSQPRFYERITAMAEADVLLLGHTHSILHARYKETAIFNPGAICSRMGGSYCATLALPDLQFTVFDVRTGQVVPVEITTIAEVTQI